jgi:hypothetical protein
MVQAWKEWFVTFIFSFSSPYLAALGHSGHTPMTLVTLAL